MMFGLSTASAASASLLNNFEIVATLLIALLIFQAKISARLWGGIGLITASCILLSLENTDQAKFQFSSGSLLILAACLCWGIENNCTNVCQKRIRCK
jgi:drug/metabolite transporter (DMT)-like permease